LQLVLSFAVAGMIWRAGRRGINDQTIALIAIGSIIVTPYAMIYDMPMVAAAIVIHWKARTDAGEPMAAREIGLSIALSACLLVMIGHSVPFAAAILLVLLFLSVADVFDSTRRSVPALNAAPRAG